MPRRKPAAGQLALLTDDLPEDPAGLFSRETPLTRPAPPTPGKPARAAVDAPAKPPTPAKAGKPAHAAANAPTHRPAPPARKPATADKPAAPDKQRGPDRLAKPARAAAAAPPKPPAVPLPESTARQLAALFASGQVAATGVPIWLLTDVYYRNYAIAVATDRAVPDVRDGLKPVQRRILYDMGNELGLWSHTPHKKSARVVGDVLGKFHPHGDVAVYDAMARMAQDFSLRQPLVDGQGNFGSADGDSPAAMRYTEARLSPAGELMLADIKSDTVDFGDNFDGTLQEPLVLPSALPNLLVNGANGIAVGLASNLPPHNLGEVCDAVIFVAQNWNKPAAITLERLMRFIPGPDFPTGGLVYRYRPDPKTGEPMDVIRQGYETGRSTLVVSSVCEIADIGGGKSEIAVTEIPYLVPRATIRERVADDRERFRAAGVSSISDLSDRNGMRLVFETVRGFDPQQVLRFILDNTKLQSSLPYGAVVVVKNSRGELEPRQCTLPELLLQFVDFRLEVIVRRSRFELRRAEERLHIVRGLLKAIEAIDEVIRIIRGSADADEARRRLMKRLEIDEIQTTAILDMQLRRLAKLEFKKLDDERKELEAKIKDLRDILASQARQLAIVVSETQAVKTKFATPRRTRIIENEGGHKAAEPVTGPAVPAGPLQLIVSAEGARCEPAASSGEKVVLGRASAKAVEVVLARTRVAPEATVLLLSSSGQTWKGPLGRVAAGISTTNGDRMVYAGAAQPGEFLVVGTRRGNIKRVKVEDALDRADNSWGQIIGLEDAQDEVLFASLAGDETHLFFCTAGSVGTDARVLRFEARGVNPQATPSARGVTGIKLNDDTLVAGGVMAPGNEGALVVLTANGFLKRVALSEFPVQGRGAQGVVGLRVTAATGPVASVAYAPTGSLVDVFSIKGKRLRLALAEVAEARRPAAGASLHRQYGDGQLFGGEALARVVVLPPG